MMKIVSVLSLFLLAGCISTPRYNIDMSMSDLSRSITGSENQIVDVSNHVTSSNSHFSANSHVSMTVDPISVIHSPNDDWDLARSGQGRFLFGQRGVLNVGVGKYRLTKGYELVFSIADNASQFRVAGFYHGANFNDPSLTGFNKPYLIGLDFDAHKLIPVKPFDVIYGVRFTTSLFGYSFNKPVSIGYETFDGDGLYVAGVGIPFGAQVDSGPFTLQALCAPTLFFQSLKSEIGYESDLGFLNTVVPISVNLGFVF